MSNLAPLPDTERLVEWDELPDSVRSIPAGFDPRKEGVLMKHQADWIALPRFHFLSPLVFESLSIIFSRM